MRVAVGGTPSRTSARSKISPLRPAQNSAQAERKALAFARNPEIMALARGAARNAIAMNLAAPLKAARYDNAKVTVRFDGETTRP